jgi:hypothetical protein
MCGPYREIVVSEVRDNDLLENAQYRVELLAQAFTKLRKYIQSALSVPRIG